MRTIDAVDADLRALGRPMHPGVASITKPTLITAWRETLAAWRATNPAGEERYCLLLEEREAIEAAALRAQQSARAARELGVLPRLVREALGRPEARPSLASAEAWLASGRTWLILAGTTGTGKSVAAGHALVKASQARQSVAWATAAGFAAAAGGFSGQAECERLKHVEVLVLDDLGAEHASPFAASVLFEVLHHRHEERGRTIITTNLGKTQLRERLGPRLADRVASDCHYVEVVGESLRGAR